MDRELLEQTLEKVCQQPAYNQYSDYFKLLNFDNVQLVYGKYLYVFPPIYGEPKPTMEATARNIFHMTYNALYNEKYNIDPEYMSEDSSDEI